MAFGLPAKGTGFSYLKNTGWITAAKVLESLISYVIVVLISRYLGAEGLGQYSFLFSFVGLFFIFADFGISSLLTKDVVKMRRDISSYISLSLSLSMLLSVASLVVYTLIVFFAFDDLLVALLIMGMYGFVNTIQLVPYSVLRARQEGLKIAIFNIVERLLSLVGAIIAISIFHSLTLFILVLLISLIVKSILMYLFAGKYFSFKFTFAVKKYRDILASSLPFLLIGLFSIIYVRLDTVLLAFLKGSEVVGWYNAGYKLINLLTLVPGLLLIFGFPLFSRWFKGQKRRLRNLFEGLLHISLLIAVPAVGGVLLFGDRIIRFIYGFDAVEAFLAFKILILVEVFVFLTAIMGHLIAATDRPKVFARIAGSGAALNILLNFLLIPKWSLYGAGVATLVTYIFMYVVMHRYIAKRLLPFSFWKYMVLPIVATLVAILGTCWLPPMHVLINILLFMVVYGVIVILVLRLRAAASVINQ
ncbi:flippase [Candidatus Woesearchaeota archaeon]|nr:flippase [Candidatus Woesearchaeota archaeon]